MSNNININELKKYIKFNGSCDLNLSNLKLTELVQQFSIKKKILKYQNGLNSIQSIN